MTKKILFMLLFCCFQANAQSVTEAEVLIVYSERSGIGEVYIFDPVTDYLQKIYSADRGNVTSISCTPSRNKLIFKETVIYQYDIVSRKISTYIDLSNYQDFYSLGVPATSIVGGIVVAGIMDETNAGLFLYENNLLTSITTTSGLDLDPHWSPDGTKLVFVRQSTDGSNNLMVVNRDGSNLLQLTISSTYDSAPQWHPSGTFITFTRDENQTAALYAVNVDGTNVRRFLNLTNVTGAVWTHDGLRVAFTSFQDGNAEIYTSNSDGTDLIRHTLDNQYDEAICWLSVSRESLLTPTPLLTPSPIPTVTPTPLPIPTLTPPPPPTTTVTPAALARLRLTSMCSADPSTVRVWRVRNPNATQTLVTWDVVGTAQTGSLIVPAAVNGVAGEALFQTVAVTGSNTTRLFLNSVQQDVRASGGAACP